MNLISIVIPVYNSEKHLKECIESVLNQTYKCLEIILINDGSTDSSGGICDWYNNNYPNIITKHMVNSGVSEARNIGMSLSHGSYIQFVDSDDILESFACERLVDYIMHYNVDIVIAGYTQFDKNGEIASINGKFQYSSTKEEFLDDFMELLNTNQIINSPVNKLFKKELIISQFRKDMSLGEDLLFNFEYLKRCNSILVIPDLIYRYRKGVSSSLTSRYRNNMLYSLIEIRKTEELFFEEMGIKEKYIVDYLFASNIYDLINIIIFNNDISLLNKKMEIYKILSNKFVINTFKIIKSNKKSINMMVYLCKKRMYNLFFFIMYLKCNVYNKSKMKNKK